MTDLPILLLADRIGVFVFALSGGIAAARKEMDLFGVLVLAFLTAVGGGTLRDLILDAPVFWLADTLSLGLSAAGGLVAFSLWKPIDAFRPLRWADAAGLALFSVAGAAKAAGLGHSFVIVLIMGTMTASAGGLLRDVVANRVPMLLLPGELYATAALLGAGVYGALHGAGVSDTPAFAAGMAAAFALRAAAIVFKWSLPTPKG